MNKIFAYISLGMVGLLLVAVVLCSFIPLNYNLSLNKNPDQIIIYKGSSQKTVTSAIEGDVYNKILELYNNSGKQSVLNSLFLGLWGKKLEADRSTSSTTVDQLHPSGTFCLVFVYHQKQPMMLNGKQYKHETEGLKQYETIYIKVSNVNEIAPVNYYVYDGFTSSPAMYFYYSAYSNQYELHKYLTEATELMA